jgi:hypothetical protein
VTEPSPTNPLSFETPRLRLVLESTEAVLARIEALPPEHRAQVSPDWLARLRAAALARFAFEAGAKEVVAHTLPASGPSTSVLAACGFRHTGEVQDPEDGPVWRWVSRRA